MDTRVGAYAVIVREGAILLSHWTEGGRWTLPGGGIEPGELPADAAVREIHEETGYTASLGDVLGVDSIVIPLERRLHGDQPLHAIRIIYAANIVSGELADEVGGSSDEARWFALDGLSEVPTLDLVAVGIRLMNQRNPAPQ